MKSGTEYHVDTLLEAMSKRTMIIGRVNSQETVTLLGTCFMVTEDGKFATTYHAIGNDARNLVLIMPRQTKANDYEDLSDNKVFTSDISPIEIDTARDIAVLKGAFRWEGTPKISLSSFDNSKLGEAVEIYGYPHCVHGRRAFTQQNTTIGAKVIINNLGVKSKQGVINTQARPGQSGSPVIDPKTGEILGMLIGAWIPPNGSGILVGGVNAAELHQTTHCVSANHIKEMI